MSDTLRYASGSGQAPLAATRKYSFTHVVTAKGEAKLQTPYVQRGTWDDYGVVERAEQEAFVYAMLKSLGINARVTYSGEWTMPDVATLDRVWAAIEATLRPPVKDAPVATVQREVSPAEARAVSERLTARVLDLVSVVAGVSRPSFVCVHSATTGGTSEGDTPKRLELWRSGEVSVRLDATALESGAGVHGEESTYAIDGTLSDGRDASAHARIDLRSGGEVSVTVRGVHDARALAERLVAE